MRAASGTRSVAAARAAVVAGQHRRAFGAAALLTALTLTLSACGGGSFTTVQVADLAAASEPNMVILDVREPFEYAEGHVPGAVLMPLSSLEQHLDEVPEGSPIYVICRSGNRSEQASKILVAGGVRNVVNVDGGMIAWQAAGYPVERVKPN